MTVDYLDAAADVFAVAKLYADQGDHELLRRVEARIVRDGYTVEQVRERAREKATALLSEVLAHAGQPRQLLLRANNGQNPSTPASRGAEGGDAT